jgi:hypothetical protein
MAPEFKVEELGSEYSVFINARNLLLSTTKRPPFPGWDQMDELGRVRLESGSDINRYLIIMDCTVKSGN